MPKVAWLLKRERQGQLYSGRDYTFHLISSRYMGGVCRYLCLCTSQKGQTVLNTSGSITNATCRCFTCAPWSLRGFGVVESIHYEYCFDIT